MEENQSPIEIQTEPETERMDADQMTAGKVRPGLVRRLISDLLQYLVYFVIIYLIASIANSIYIFLTHTIFSDIPIFNGIFLISHVATIVYFALKNPKKLKQFLTGLGLALFLAIIAGACTYTICGSIH